MAMLTCAVCGADRGVGCLIIPEFNLSERRLHLCKKHTAEVRHYIARLNQQHRDALHAQ